MKKFLIPSALILAGCNSVDTGTANVNLVVGATSDAQPRAISGFAARSANSVAATDTLTIEVTSNQNDNGSIALTSARFVIEEIELDSERDDDDLTEDESEDLELAFEGPIIADAVTQTLTPELPAAAIEAGLYQELEVDVDPVTEADWGVLNDSLSADDKLRQGYSTHLQGTYTDIDNVVYDFEVLLDGDFEKEQVLANDLVLTDGSVTDLSVSFDLTGLFNNIDLVAMNAAGVIVIDSKGENSDVADLLIDRIEDALELAEEL